MKFSATSLRFPVALLALALSALTRPAMAESETRKTESFSAVSFEGSWSVDVELGKENSITIEGDKDVIGRVKTDVIDGALHIRLEDGHSSIFSHRDVGKLTARITMPKLTAFSLKGSGNATIGKLDGGATEFALNGSGDLTALGRLDTLAVVVNGSGQADLSGLVAAKASATINGSGEATVHPEKSLAAVVNGSGQITYLGDGSHVTSVVNGSGQVEKR